MKSTDVELPGILELHNNDGELDALIERCKNGEYHDFKNTTFPAPKSQLVRELEELGLHEIALRVMDGEFDE